ncbi:hypothetical protein ACIGO8_15335 [Streptomyces sp. NPDC053493]|uniref:hypothetical protein n=1 Tax=Streptomyces sp. NPDC053493 TaxID=3365705 RepID=UPI0037CE0056
MDQAQGPDRASRAGGAARAARASGAGGAAAGVGLDLPAVARALRTYRWRAGAWAGGGLAAIVAGGLLTGLAEEPRTAVPPLDLGPALLGVGLVTCVLGLGSLVIARRMRRALSARPWSAHPALLVPRGLNAARVVLADPATGEAWPLAVVATQQRIHLARPGAGGVLWWCGDPRRGGVLAPPGGGALIWTRPVRGAQERRLLARRAAQAGLLGPAAPEALRP